jgi:hypothetical protein
MKSGSRGVQQNLFCNFWTLLQVFMNFGSLKQFLKFKQLKNDLKSPHSVGSAARFLVRAPQSRGGCAGQGGTWRGSPRRSVVSGMAGSSRHDGVPTAEGGEVFSVDL